MKKRGFTLIEILIVIALIGVLSAVVLSSLNTSRLKARDAQRRSSLDQVKVALELYHNDYGNYPIYNGGVYVEGKCSGAALPTNWTVMPNYTGANAWIPNLAPTYLPQLPGDPVPSASAARCFTYGSDATGQNYTIWAHNGIESSFSASDPMVRLLPSACTAAQATFTVFGGTSSTRCN
jgi:prepilin-type N-terminal cleavage/methylation domain-containing protein